MDENFNKGNHHNIFSSNYKSSIAEGMNNIIDSIEDIEMSEEQIQDIKNKIKQIDKKLKTKNKPKTITISGYDHAIIKNYCSIMNLNIGEWASKVLVDKINNDRCFEIVEDKEDFTNVEMDKITQRWFVNNQNVNLYKLSKLVFSKDFTFKGYSITDGRPLYICKDFNSSTKAILDTYGIECDLTSSKEIGKGIEHNLDLELQILYYV